MPKARRYPIPPKPLTAQQQLFVAEYLKDLNADAAWKRAGYTGTSRGRGAEILQHPDVAAAVNKAVKARIQRTEVTTDWVVQELQRVYYRCMEDIPVYDAKGEPTGTYEFDASNANKSLELLGRHLQMFTTKVEVDIPEGSVYAELMELVRARLARDVTPQVAALPHTNGNGEPHQ